MQRTPLAAALVLLLTPAIQAAESLEPVVVTATRTAQTVDSTLASVTIITRADIERTQARSVPELLAGTPGVAIANSGGMGKATSVFLRGSNSDHVLVLVDGIKLGSATLGTAALEHIPVDSIDRIEVVRGPRASLYGSEAIGGVIQVFTRKGGGASRVRGQLTAGSYGTTKGSIGVSGGGEHGWYDLTASTVETDGFNACYGKPFPNGAGCFTTEPDKDGYSNEAASLRAGYRFANGLSIDMHALGSRGEIEFDGDFVNESEPFQRVVGVDLGYDISDSVALNLSVGRTTDVSANAKDGVSTSRFQTDRDAVTLQTDWSVTDNHLVTLGVDYQNDEVSGTTAYAIAERDNTGLFLEYQGLIGGHDVGLRLRQDDNEQFGDHATGGISVGRRFAGNLRLTASYDTGFKAPTFNELYFPGFGNDQLQPETSESIELGLRGQQAWGHWAVTLYQTEIDDLIAFDATTFAPGNISSTRIRGLEGELGRSLAGWDVNAALTLLEPEHRGDDANNGNTLPRRAKSSLRLDADRAWGKWRVGGTMVAVSKRYDDLANQRELDAYARVDLRAEYQFTSDWQLQLKGENIFYEDYETAAFYNQPGASAYLTLRYQP